LINKVGKKALERAIVPGRQAIHITTDVRRTLHAKPLGDYIWRDQLTPIEWESTIGKRAGGWGRNHSAR
jgi:hypothetical protein